MQLKAAANRMDFYSLNSLNNQFHGEIHSHVKNDFIRLAVQNLGPQYSRLSYLNLSDIKDSKKIKAHYKLIFKDHNDMLNAFRQRDKERIFKHSTVHLKRFYTRIKTYFTATETFIEKDLFFEELMESGR